MNDTPLTFGTLDLDKITEKEWVAIKSEISKRFGTCEENTISGHVFKSHMAGRWLLITMLKRAGLSDDRISKLSVSHFGKPFLPDSNCFFNLSHSANLIVCVVSHRGKVGVDIEAVKPLEVEHYRDCFSASEWESIHNNADPNRRALELWTIKESILKADGRGLQQSMSDVILENNSASILHENAKWFWKSISLTDFVCCVCAEFEIDEITMM